MSPPKNAFTPLYIPIINLPAVDIQLRPEYLAVFKYANIESSHLITLDDLPPLSNIRSKLDPDNTAWILVDHNAFQGQLSKVYLDRVAGVVDHHVDEQKVPKDTGHEPRLIEKAGSCTSLVTNYLRPAWDTLSQPALPSGTPKGQDDSVPNDAQDMRQWDAEVSQLGIASILIDTVNLLDKDKTTNHDREAVEYLEGKIRLCPQVSATYERKTFYERIDAAKKEIGALSLQDILRKDYKQWEQSGQRLGVSSVVKSIDFLQKKAGDEATTQSSREAFLNALDEFAKDRKLDTYALMTTSTSAEGDFQRELLVWAFNEKAVEAAKKFAQNSSDELGLEGWGSSSSVDGNDDRGQWRRVWRQKALQHSRKRVAPLLREAMI